MIALNWLTIKSPPHTALYSIHRFLLREVSETSVTVRQSKISNYSRFYTKNSDPVKKLSKPIRTETPKIDRNPNRNNGLLLVSTVPTTRRGSTHTYFYRTHLQWPGIGYDSICVKL